MREVRMIRHAAYFVLQRAGPRRLELETVAACAGAVDVAGRERREHHGAPFKIADALLWSTILGVALNGHDELRAEHRPHLTFDADVARRQTVQRDVDLERHTVGERDLGLRATDLLQRHAGPRGPHLLLP